MWRLLLPALALLFAFGLDARLCRAATADDDSAEAKARRVEQIQRALKAAAPPVPNRRQISAGSGFFVATERVLTNRHVVEGCPAITTEGADGDTLVADVAAVDPDHDLALVRTMRPAPAVARFSIAPRYVKGDMIAVVGYPDQGLQRIVPFVTSGSMLGVDGRDPTHSRFAVSADVRHGDSGGPVLNVLGRVIGVINAKVDTVKVYQKTGKVVDDIGLGIANVAVLDFLRHSGVEVTQDEGDKPLDDRALLTELRPVMVRIACWK
ncbi:MAG TPA: serine protease [Candidatus Cybelea sp.]|nr:serine protease [Candidatus Cybelea sp.]